MVNGLDFVWDDAKAALNLGKHGVSFEEAESVFSDPDGLLISDPEHSDAEDRFVLLGLGFSLRLLVVVHVYREPGTVRIISVRKANRMEAYQYASRR